MRTDTTERGLERLMCTALAGHPVRSAGRGRRRGSACGPRRGGVERRQLSRLRPGVLCRLGTARGVRTGYAAGGRRRVDVVQGRSDAARVPDSAAGGDCQARYHRRVAQRDQTSGAAPGSVLRHALGAQCRGAGAVREEPVHGYPAALLQPGRRAAVAGFRAVHQRTRTCAHAVSKPKAGARQSGSEVACRTTGDQVTQYLNDARALQRIDDLPPGAAARALPLFCRLAMEAARTEVVRRRIGRARDVLARINHADPSCSDAVTWANRGAHGADVVTLGWQSMVRSTELLT